MGDLVVATPFLQAAADQFHITLLAKPFAADLRSRFWPTVELVPFNAPWTAFRHKYQMWRWPWREMVRLHRQLAAQSFDFGVSARWDPRDHLTLQLAGTRERLGFPRLKSQRFLTQALLRPEPQAHHFEYWRVAGQALGLKLPPRRDIFSTARPRPPLVLIHTGARLPLRVWPLENFHEIALRLRRNHVAVQIICDASQVAWWQSRGETPACPRTVTELLARLDGAGVFLGNDSGPGHLAAACGLPTFTWFGPQLPEWFIPLHPASEAVEGRACPYKPCSDYCHFVEPFCLRDVSVEETWPRVEAFVRKNLKAGN